MSGFHSENKARLPGHASLAPAAAPTTPLAASSPLESHSQARQQVEIVTGYTAAAGYTATGSIHEDSSTIASPAQHADGDGMDWSRGDRPKQKRNKPTLSCVECVERKTSRSLVEVGHRV